MRGKCFTIVGHVRRKRDATGIHGLSIEVILKKGKPNIIYTRTLSARDSVINLIVRDRSGRQIQQTGIGARARNGQSKSINLILNDEALSVHEVQALSIESVDSTLRPSAAHDRIYDAIRLTSPAGECGGTVKAIVGMPNHSIEDPVVIKKIRCAGPA